MATRNPNATLSLTLLDASGEKSVMQLNSIEFNIATIAGDLSAVTDFRTSVGLISGGSIVNQNFTQWNERFNAVKPTDKNFQRERKWLVRYQDDVTFNVYRLEIPCAKVVGTASAPLVDAYDNAIITAPDWATWIADFEQVARSQDGNFVTFLDAKLVGRNL